MAETFTRFDAAEYLTTDEDVAGFLDAAAEGGDPAHLARALATVARGRNMSKLARDTGISREGLYKALSPEGNPSFATVVRVAGALGLKLSFTVNPSPAHSA